MNTDRAATRTAQASRLVAGDPLPPRAELTAESTRALGWALKDLCYASWSSEPQRAVRAADALRRLRDTVKAAVLPAARSEVQALAAWTGGIAHVIKGEMEEAIAAFNDAHEGFANLGQPCHAAQTQVPKIMALAMLGRHDDAAHCAGVAQRTLLENGDLQSASKVSLNLGNLHLRADRYAAAAERFREAAVLFARLGDAEHGVMADNGLADALTALGDLDQAQQTYERARACAAAHSFAVLEAVTEESVALLALVRGRYSDALVGLEQSRRRYAALEMPQHLAIAEKQLGDAYLELRLLPESLVAYEAALDRFRALDMQVDLAWTLVQRGRSLALAGQRAAAAVALAEAAQHFEALDSTTGVAAVALAQAELALVGADGVRALALAREAASHFRQAALVERRLRAETVQAQALLQIGDAALARTLFDATLDAARQYQLLPVQLRCLTGGAMAALAVGDRASARAGLEAAVDLFEDQRCTLAGDEVRSAFQVDHLLPFQQLLRLEIEAHEAGRSGAADVLAQLDRFRARTLADRLGVDERGSAERQAPQSGMQDLRARLRWLHRRLHRLHDEAGASAAVAAELRATEGELLERARRNRLSQGLANPVREPAELDIGSLQSLLEPGDALVEYGVHGDELFCCVVTREGVQLKRHLAAWPQVVEAVRALRFQIETLRHGSAALQSHLPTLERRALAHLQRLHALVWQPLEPLLGKRQRVLVVAHAQLGSVPFAALHDGRRSLADLVQIVVAPSARFALQALAKVPRSAVRVLALGESTRLPNAAREARAVAGLLPQGRAFVDREATLATLRAHGGGADVIHLACHAQFRTDNPVFSALHLHDGVLTAEVIETLDLPASVVVLSGCETGLSDVGGSDEMFGLTRAFLLAGAARVLAALWPVDDATTAELMFDFYSGLRRGQPPAAALRRAQLAARRRNAHPFYWAAFAIVGRW